MKLGIREIIFLIILLSVPIAAFKFVFMPRNAEILQAKNEIVDKESKLRKLAEAGNKIEDLSVTINALNDAVTMIEDRLPQEKRVDDVLRRAWEIARGHVLTIKKVEPQNPLPASRYMELPINVELEGSFDGFYLYLLDLEQMPRLTKIKDLHIERLDESLGTIRANFTLSVYFQTTTTDNSLIAGANQ